MRRFKKSLTRFTPNSCVLEWYFEFRITIVSPLIYPPGILGGDIKGGYTVIAQGGDIKEGGDIKGGSILNGSL